MNNAQLAFAVPDAGNHPQFPSVPIIQLTYDMNLEQAVIAIQFIPLVVQWGEIF